MFTFFPSFSSSSFFLLLLSLSLSQCASLLSLLSSPLLFFSFVFSGVPSWLMLISSRFEIAFCYFPPDFSIL